MDPTRIFATLAVARRTVDRLAALDITRSYRVIAATAREAAADLQLAPVDGDGVALIREIGSLVDAEVDITYPEGSEYTHARTWIGGVSIVSLAPRDDR